MQSPSSSLTWNSNQFDKSIDDFSLRYLNLGATFGLWWSDPPLVFIQSWFPPLQEMEMLNET
jgi:hypothetical protein